MWEVRLIEAALGRKLPIVLSDELKSDVYLLLETLTPREEKVLKMRFDDALSLSATGAWFTSPCRQRDGLGLTRERIRQIEVKALHKFRHLIKQRLGQ